MRSAVLAGLFWAILAMSILVLAYPWRFQTRSSRLLVHLPLVLLMMFGIYELLMPTQMNIRVDLLVLLPLFGLVLLSYLARLVLLSRSRKTPERKV